MNKIVQSFNNTVSATFTVPKDGNYNISCKECKNTRTSTQCNYHWGAVIPFIQDFYLQTTGEKKSKDEAHLIFKESVGWYDNITIFDVVATEKHGRKIYRETKLYHTFTNDGDISTKDYVNALEMFAKAMVDFTKGEWILPFPDNNNNYSF